MSIRCLLLGGLALVAACDTKAQPAAAAASVDPARLSAEHESCGTSAHCAEGLRCFAHVCTRTDRSLIGDYYAQLGARRRDAGEIPAALEAYGEALKHYGVEKLAVPAEIECAYGAALTGEDDKELAAKVLHRCLAAAPAGSTLRSHALHAAAALHDAKLDPAHFVREEPADKYLTREGGAPAKPKTDDLKVTVTASPEPRKGWPEWSAAIQAAAPALKACWETSYATTKSKILSANVPIRSTYKVDPDYPDDGGKWVTGVDAKAAPPASPADGCVRDAVTVAVKGQRAISNWDATVNVTIQ